MSRARAICAGMIIALLVLMMVGCELGSWGRAAAPNPPLPPAPPVPPSAPGAGSVSADQKLVAGNLHVEYIPPCALRGAPAEWVAPIRLTDLRSGSVVYLNRNGSLRESPKPDYKTEEGRAALEAALKDKALVKEIVGRPACPEMVYNPTVMQRGGWPDAFAVDLGDPPMPRVAIGVSPRSIESTPRSVYPGWRGAYCWPVSGGVRECEDTADWKGFGGAEALGSGRFYVAVLGDEDNPGVVRRVRVFPAQERRANRGRGRELHLGAEVHKVVATRGESLEKFTLPRLPAGDYMLIADYESPLGEVEYGFKVEVR